MAKKTLYVFRAENGIWRKELSDKIGVDETTLKQIEDEPEVPQEIAEKVISAYGLPEDYFTVDPNAKDKRYKPKNPFKYFLKVSLAWEFLIAIIFAVVMFPTTMAGVLGTGDSPLFDLLETVCKALVIAFSGVIITSANSIVNSFTKGDKIEHIEDVSSLASRSDVKNILFIGADKEKGGASRSDSIMIISVNKSAGKVIVTSILRDTHVDIPGECEAKINSAYAWGGANLLIQTIEQNFGLKIDGYAVVNFNMFTELVDGLGGIDIEVTENEADYINNRHNYKSETKPDYFESGESVHLNGYQTLWYARIRKLDSDFMRTYRQRKVITAIAENIKNELLTGNIFGLISTAKDVAPNIETSLSSAEFTSLLLGMVSCVSKSGLEMDKLLVSQQLPFEDTWWFESKWDGSSIALDLSENREMLYNSIYEPQEVEETTENE